MTGSLAPDLVTRFRSGVTALSISFAWRWECEAARNLLQNAHQLQSVSVEPWSNIDSTLTLLTLGVEKTLKLALGCCHIRDRGEGWPSHLSAYKHRSSQMQSALLTKVGKAAAQNPNAIEIAQVVKRIESDQLWQTTILVLDKYGSGGRFHYLDVLSQSPKREILGGPRESWLAVLSAAMEQVGVVFDHQAPDDEIAGLTNRAVCDSILTWWESISRLGTLGAFGDIGVELGKALRLPEWDG